MLITATSILHVCFHPLNWVLDGAGKEKRGSRGLDRLNGNIAHLMGRTTTTTMGYIIGEMGKAGIWLRFYFEKQTENNAKMAFLSVFFYFLLLVFHVLFYVC